MPRTVLCPICGKPAQPRRANPAYPFCSDRCRLIDLGKWLGETYRVPGPHLGDGAEAPARPVDHHDEEDQ